MRYFSSEKSRNDTRKEIFNNRLGKARSLWRIFLRPTELRTDKIQIVVSAACLLCNLMRFKKHISARTQEEPKKKE
ncbi:hypothetical protein PR048_016689 [Dryococelus australis]|uniref:DDE Tnp4 domain-containing protein n=1 Tax=Dryococelus australis TaxID=614101 RepID=A0ABQ9H7Z5_9NEOP|nr:hypothetical protein PR048_016689 [Dryococelus australis]